MLCTFDKLGNKFNLTRELIIENYDIYFNDIFKNYMKNLKNFNDCKKLSRVHKNVLLKLIRRILKILIVIFFFN